MSASTPADLRARIEILERQIRNLQERVEVLEKLTVPRMEHPSDSKAIREKVTYDWQA